jgi:DNA-binding transcriptional regulator LsrR (DeoR family)
MAKPRIPDLHKRAEEAAFLKGEGGWPQIAIARKLGVSQAAVSRLLVHARKTGNLHEVSRFEPAGMSQERLDELARLLEHSELADALMRIGGGRSRLRSVRIFDSGSTDTTPSAIASRQRQFGRAVAPRVAEHLRRAEVVGVTWGSTVSNAIDALSRLGYPWPAADERRVLPMSAEPLQFAHNEFTSSTLARRLHEIVNPGTDLKRSQLALTGVPAFIPADLSQMLPETRALSPEVQNQLHDLFRRFFEVNSRAFNEIFVGPEALIEQVDMLVTSVGAEDKPMGFCNEDLRKFGRLDAKRLQELVVGDVGGVLLHKPNLPEAEIAVVQGLNAMWTGIKQEHLASIAKRAGDGKPGVVVLAVGASRTPVVLAALARGLCSELLIDRDLATALSAALNVA